MLPPLYCLKLLVVLPQAAAQLLLLLPLLTLQQPSDPRAWTMHWSAAAALRFVALLLQCLVQGPLLQHHPSPRQHLPLLLLLLVVESPPSLQ
jgi:hypothetical protein